jgi:hypothetical protein
LPQKTNELSEMSGLLSGFLPAYYKTTFKRRIEEERIEPLISSVVTVRISR